MVPREGARYPRGRGRQSRDPRAHLRIGQHLLGEDFRNAVGHRLRGLIGARSEGPIEGSNRRERDVRHGTLRVLSR